MIHSLKRLWTILQPFHRSMGIFLFLLVLYEGMKVAETYFQSALLTLYNSEAELRFWIFFFAGLLIFDEIYVRFDGYLDLRIIDISNKIYQHLKTKSLAKLFWLDLRWHKENQSGVVAEKVNKGVDKIADLVEEASWDMVPTLVQVAVSLIPVAIFAPWIALLVLVMLILFLNESRKAYNAQEPMRKNRYDLYEKEAGDAVESIQAVEPIRYSGRQQAFQNGYENLHGELYSTATEEARIMILRYSRRRVRMLNITKRIVWASFALQLVTGGLSVASFVFILTLTEKVLNSFWRLSRMFDRIGESIEPIKRLNDLFDQPRGIEFVEPEEKQSVCAITDSSVEFRNVTFSYGEGKPGIHEVSFVAKPGTVTALVGSSGAGKSTLMHVLMRQSDIASGTITVGGDDIRSIDEPRLYSLFAHVPQDAFIFKGTIRYNLTLGEAVEQSKIDAACHAAAFDQTIEKLKDQGGYEAQVGERGVKLSGGEKQRLALARALLRKDAKVLILDEPTSAQDTVTEARIQQHVFKAFAGPVFVIAHRLSTVKDADQILVMDAGRIVEKGTHHELVARGGHYAKLVQGQMNT